MATIEEIEKKRAARRDAANTARADQELADLTAIDKLEEERGELLHTMSANRFTPGAPVKIAFRAPTSVEYKRYKDQVNAAVTKSDARKRVEAQELLASAVLEYPAKGSEALKGALEAFPGLLISLAIEAAKVAELRAEDEGKG